MKLLFKDVVIDKKDIRGNVRRREIDMEWLNV